MVLVDDICKMPSVGENYRNDRVYILLVVIYFVRRSHYSAELRTLHVLLNNSYKALWGFWADFSF